jgi:DNA-binding beta-propeller fold protein YncE
MAIDTEVKRRSVHGYAGNSATIAPVPDGAALNEGDRRQVAGIYRGITSGAGSTLTGTAGSYITATTALYGGFLFAGPISITNVTNFESGGGESAVSFDHETPAGDYRLLTVIATYKDTAGVASLVFGSAGSGDGEFNNPNGIAVDTDGSIYVADSSNHRIQVFDSTGAFVDKWGSNGSGDGEFNAPVGIAVSGGYVYVTDAGNNRVQVRHRRRICGEVGQQRQR